MEMAKSMQGRKIKIARHVLLAGMVLWAGCESHQVVPLAAQMHCEGHITKADAMQAAQDVLLRMDFAIEKLDVEQGILWTRPLRGAQFFEFWRRDNVGSFATVEANLQTVRRTVELRVGTQDAGTSEEDGNVGGPPSAAAGPLTIECRVSVQRLSLPENEIPSISQTFRIHSQSKATAQRIAVTPQQERAMAWVDLGKDPDLAVEILRRVSQKLERLD
jgi:hypothetical protein